MSGLEDKKRIREIPAEIFSDENKMFESPLITESSLILASVLSVVTVSSLLVSCLRCGGRARLVSLCQCWKCCDSSSLPALHTNPETTESVVFEPLPPQIVSLAHNDRADQITEGIEKSSIIFKDTIGHGWFGWIVSGTIKNTRILVKVLKEEASPEEIERFRGEHDDWCGVKHSNVTKVVGSCFTTFPMLSLLEWSPHLSAKTHLLTRQSSPDLDLSLQLCMDACAGLAALHGSARPVVVRDLAVRNCVLTQHNVLKIADYGLGRAAFPADYWPVMTESVPLRWTAAGQLEVQQHRSLPEFRGVSREDNLWALGIVIWELLTYCRQPYRGLSDKEVMQLLLDREDVRHHFRAEPQTGLKYKCVAQLALNNLELDQTKR